MLGNIIRYQEVVKKQLDLQLQEVVIRESKARNGMETAAIDKLVPQELRAALDFLAKERQDLEATMPGDIGAYMQTIMEQVIGAMDENASQMADLAKKMEEIVDDE